MKQKIPQRYKLANQLKYIEFVIENVPSKFQA